MFGFVISGMSVCTVNCIVWEEEYVARYVRSEPYLGETSLS